jgi:HSP20 family molecular chaperone IbpA
MTAMRTMGLAPVLPPEASVEKSADEYVVRLAVSGFARQELEVEVKGRCVTVRGDQLEAGIDESPFRVHERLEANGSSKLPRKVPIGQVTTVNPDACGV